MGRIILSLLIVLTVGAVGYAQTNFSQNASQMVHANVTRVLTVTVSRSLVDFGNLNPAECKTFRDNSVIVTSNINWTLNIRSDSAYPDGRLQVANNPDMRTARALQFNWTIHPIVRLVDEWRNLSSAAQTLVPDGVWWDPFFNRGGSGNQTRNVSYQLCSQGTSPSAGYQIPVLFRVDPQ